MSNIIIRLDGSYLAGKRPENLATLLSVLPLLLYGETPAANIRLRSSDRTLLAEDLPFAFHKAGRVSIKVKPGDHDDNLRTVDGIVADMRFYVARSKRLLLRVQVTAPLANNRSWMDKTGVSASWRWRADDFDELKKRAA